MLKFGCPNSSVLRNKPENQCSSHVRYARSSTGTFFSARCRAVITRGGRESATDQWNQQQQQQQHQQQHFEYPPIDTVTYDPHFLNTACLVGTVLGSVQAVMDKSDQIVAGLLYLRVENLRADHPDVYEVHFPADLLDIITQQVVNDSSIYVQGPLSVHLSPSSPEQPGNTMMGVISALSIYLIQGNANTGVMVEADTPPGWGSPLASADTGAGPSTSASRGSSASSEQAWQALVDAPNQYYDNRVDKKNPKAPDFKHKTSGDALWLNDAPDWAQQQLLKIPPPQSKDDAWRAVLEHPDHYYDNRADKKNPKAPDFKHKVDGGALWMNDAPQWAFEQLQSMPAAQSSQRGAGKDAQWEAVLSTPDQYFDNRSTKTNPKAPDFKHRSSGEALWMNDAPQWALDRLQSLPAAQSSQRGAGKDAQWEAVLSSPDQYYDNREGKLNPKSPDFKHKTSGEALWINDAPQWALDSLQSMPAAQSSQRGAGKDSQWEAVLSTPDQYYDNRADKLNPKSPDFKHKSSGEALWMNDAPQWALDRLQALPAARSSQRGAGKDAQWEAVLAAPDQYFDNRFTKMNDKAPDFKHKSSGEALWMNDAPQWALDQLQAGPLSGGKDGGAKDAQWEAVLSSPDQYYDNRQSKPSPKGPDFKHKTSGEALWMNDAPQWALDRLSETPPAQARAGGSNSEGIDAKWEAVLNSPGDFFDNRDTKMNPKSPDFKHKKSGEALWVSSAPSWVLERLQ